MRAHDSSRTRVKPVFDTLLARDPTGQSWLPSLLALPEGVGSVSHPTVCTSGSLTAWGWDKKERSLSPPQSLLRWLVQQAILPQGAAANDTGETRVKREALIRRDPTVIAEALRLLDQPTTADSPWYILEGLSRPDVYLETSELLIVIEGKRTEAGPTRKTKWMRGRDQMLRHLDVAWEHIKGQRLLGFYIVEGEGGADDLLVPRKWRGEAQKTVSSQILATSLPHRTPEEKQAIAAAFLGVTTWQRVCANLALDYTVLPDT